MGRQGFHREPLIRFTLTAFLPRHFDDTLGNYCPVRNFHSRVQVVSEWFRLVRIWDPLVRPSLSVVGPCISPNMAGRSLKPATDRGLGELLPPN